MASDDDRIISAIEQAMARHQQGDPLAGKISLAVGLLAIFGAAFASISSYIEVKRDVAELRKELGVIAQRGSQITRDRLFIIEHKLGLPSPSGPTTAP